MSRGAALVFVLALGLAACAPGPNVATEAALCGPDLAGFWLGWWHGMIVFFSAVAQLFGADVNLYETCNTGGWYNLGFLLGVGSGGSAGSRARRPRRSDP